MLRHALPSFALIAATASLLALGCSDILPVETVDLCKAKVYHPECAQCRAVPRAARCEQCQGTNPDPMCENAPHNDSGTGTGGTSGTGGTGGTGNDAGGTGATGGSGGMGGSGGTDGGSGTGGTGTGGDASVDSGMHCSGNTDCGDTTPICNLTTGKCKACTTKSQCKDAGGFCDTSTGACVGCLAHADCKGASKPQCTDGACVACTGDDPCTGGTPRCDTTNSSTTKGQCVQCLAHADCNNPNPQCDGASRTCVKCSGGNDACAGRVDGSIPITVCNPYATAEKFGQCVQCTGDNEATACGDNSCKRSTGTCTGAMRHSRTDCTTCVADSECSATAKCVLQKFGQDTFGPYCFYVDSAPNHCANTTDLLRPYSRSAAATSVDGSSADFCFPPTTCKAVEDATAMGASGGKACVSAADCGELNVSDGYCVDSGPAVGKCSYGCDDHNTNDNSDCPRSGFTTCAGAGIKFCQP